MRAVIQRVSEATVTVDGTTVGSIGHGLVVLLGIAANDDLAAAHYLADKTVHLRIFDDPNGTMNLSALDCMAEVLVVSQFTLLADCRKGRRPSYAHAAAPEMAKGLYRHFIARIAEHGLATASGTFQAMMQVSLVNDGPVTILLDSTKTF